MMPRTIIAGGITELYDGGETTKTPWCLLSDGTVWALMFSGWQTWRFGVEQTHPAIAAEVHEHAPQNGGAGDPIPSHEYAELKALRALRRAVTQQLDRSGPDTLTDLVVSALDRCERVTE